MKRVVLGLLIGFLLMGFNGFAADGDLIVNGNVGIGTAAPNYKLEVIGTGRFSDRLTTGAQTWTGKNTRVFKS